MLILKNPPFFIFKSVAQKFKNFAQKCVAHTESFSSLLSLSFKFSIPALNFPNKLMHWKKCTQSYQIAWANIIFYGFGEINGFYKS